MEPMEANITKLQGSELTQVSVVQQSTKKSDLTPNKVVGGSPLSSLRVKRRTNQQINHCGLAGHSPSKCFYCD